MTVPNRAVPPLHTFKLQPWSSGTPPVAAAGADAPQAAGEAAGGATGDVPQVMGFLHDLDAVTYDMRQRVLDAGLRKHPDRLVRVATWVRWGMREFRRLLSPAAKPL